MRRGDGNLKEQLGRYLQATERLQVLSRRVREVMEEQGVPLSAILPYRNFARRVLKLIDKFEMRTRYIMVMEAVGDAVAYGCDQAILVRICRDVLGYDIEDRGQEPNYQE